MKPVHRSPQGEERPSARRRLIRGVFSSAAIVPLSSGANIAASSAIRCFNNTPVDQGRNISGNVYAVPVFEVTFTEVVVLQGNDKKGPAPEPKVQVVNLVKVSSITTLGALEGFNVSALQSTTGWLLATSGQPKPFTPPSDYRITKEAETSAVVLRFVNNGSGPAVDVRAVGLGLDPLPNNGRDRVLYHSCWASFKP